MSTTALESLCERLCAAVAAGDLDAVVDLYAADAVVSLAHGREAAGSAAIRAAWAAALASGLDLTGGGVSSTRVVVCGALAMTSATGSDGVVRTQVARLVDGRWTWWRDGSHLAHVELPPAGEVGVEVGAEVGAEVALEVA
ncbi:nuclear transport factor 2 family protein [Terracoccus luteus]|jgi:ketosteroid isomerase-like protein|uniref:Ketosteroid isomerase-like protein n=1 Tax=Terracoccus luteus TaxID=53356 RepID=A0A839PZY8_9MICO|nr:nuclear transport factor 2 family protein [Terracoccus luteus]MBB2987585.1 ketosteroid isomerase-like protein [Terracoccus luteus]MCP2173236.1 ketosteroid isomerase-like protein [Terracoccus luteus]